MRAGVKQGSFAKGEGSHVSRVCETLCVSGLSRSGVNEFGSTCCHQAGRATEVP